MRWFVRLCIVVVTVALAAPFFISGPGGRPLASIDDIAQWWRQAREQVASRASAMTDRARRWGDNEASGPVAVYRWRDASGTWNYSDEAPPGVDAERLYVDPNANTFSAPANRAPTAAATRAGEPASGLSTVQEVLDEAREARRAIEARQSAETR